MAKGSISSFDDNSKAAKNQRNAQASVLASLPKVKVGYARNVHHFVFISQISIYI